MTAEEGVNNFIKHLTGTVGMTLSDEDKTWLHEKGAMVFDTYYIDKKLSISISSDEDRESLDEYFYAIQEAFGYMFAHIILAEFKLYLIEQGRKQ